VTTESSVNGNTGAQESLQPASSGTFSIVGVGASAGGLEALERLFLTMPADSGLAFVVIQHLSPDFRSLMDELLARHTAIPIRRADNGMTVEPNTIYLMPPKTEMIIADGKLLLSEKDSSQGLTLPIDVFFRSLAEDAGSRAIGIVLSGTGSDGSRGIRAIHEAGGLVIVQSEESSKFDGMPRSAIETGIVDFVLTPEEMPQTLINYVRHPLGGASIVDGQPAAPFPGGMEYALQLLRKAYGLDFAHYKPNMVARRIERRLLINRMELDAYVTRLERDSAELNALYKDLLIGVTRFFREPASFQRLEKDILPALVAQTSPRDEIRIWVAGCATGEEAYSLAMLLAEQLRLLGRTNPVKIFATDVHRQSLDIAGAGRFSEASIAGVDPGLVQRYFIRQGDDFLVTPELRKMIVFAPHNVVKDAPFTKLDLVSCRNLLIYFQPAAQRKVLSMFHFGLKTGGVLLLGPSESPGDLAEEFETLDGHWKIYRKRRDVRLAVGMPLSPDHTPLPPALPPQLATRLIRPRPGFVDTNMLRAYDAMLEQFIPPAILLNERREVVHCFGGAGRYLSVHDGRHTNDVLSLVSDDLKLAVAGLLQRSTKEHKLVTFTGVRVRTTEGEEQLKLSARLLEHQGHDTGFMLLVLERQASVMPAPAAAEEVDGHDMSQVSRRQLDLVESELRYTKENLQATVEELEMSNEELQATNEELVASNEELQSTNEELHSVNEELYTVNAEYQRKIHELTELTDDIDNLLKSTDVGTVFLDRNLCVRKFTPRVADVFHLLPQDIGRRIDSFAHSIRYPNLLTDVASVLATGLRIERQVQDERGIWYFLRILPYQSNIGVEGVVVTLIDISTLKRAEDNLARMSAIIENSDEAIVGKDLDGRIISWNKGAERLYQYTASEVLGRPADILSPLGDRDELDEFVRRVIEQGAVHHLETKRKRKDGSLIEVALTLTPSRDDSGAIIGVSGISHDITGRKQSERQLARLAMVANRTDNLVVVTDSAGHIEWVNDAFTRLTEYTLEEVVGRKPGEILQGPRTDPQTIIAMRERLLHREGFNVELVNYTKGGREYWVAIEARPVFNELGAVTGFVALETDITARKHAEIEAREAVERRDRFLAMLSHELRNPLAAILNATHVLNRSQSEPRRVSQACGVIERQSSQMARLLDDLLDVARVTQGKIQVSKEPVDVAALASDVVEAIRPLVEARRHELQVDVAAGPLWVEGDRVRLQQMQVNLLTNAAKYTPQGGRISLSIHPDGDEVVIHVRDTGVGIPQEMLSQIFDMFVQCHNTLDRADGGMGVGLTLVRALVAIHGGSVTAQSAGPGQGSEFVVRLPLASAPLMDRSASLPSRVNEQGLKIVIVEDNPDSREMLQFLLQFDGYEVQGAHDGMEGLKLIIQTRPDVAIVDIGLPGIDGYQIARRVRETLGNQLYLVALTGYGRPEDREAVLAAGFDEHLVKPLNPDELARVIGANVR
jgi:two-component system CheB/CheR fusion protein